MKKPQNSTPASSGASARSDVPPNPNAGSLPISFEAWLHDDASLISLEAEQEIPLPRLLPLQPEIGRPEGGSAEPNAV